MGYPTELNKESDHVSSNTEVVALSLEIEQAVWVAVLRSV